jgi:hypothetical protein
MEPSEESKDNSENPENTTSPVLFSGIVSLPVTTDDIRSIINRLYTDILRSKPDILRQLAHANTAIWIYDDEPRYEYNMQHRLLMLPYENTNTKNIVERELSRALQMYVKKYVELCPITLKYESYFVIQPYSPNRTAPFGGIHDGLYGLGALENELVAPFDRIREREPNQLTFPSGMTVGSMVNKIIDKIYSYGLASVRREIETNRRCIFVWKTYELINCDNNGETLRTSFPELFYQDYFHDLLNIHIIPVLTKRLGCQVNLSKMRRPSYTNLVLSP